jgi:hypothetical protein
MPAYNNNKEPSHAYKGEDHEDTEQVCANGVCKAIAKRQPQPTKNAMYDRVCKQQYGAHSEYDGSEGCKCADGYVQLEDGSCGPAQVKQQQQHQGGGGGKRPQQGKPQEKIGAKSGLTYVDDLCKKEHGDGAEFDGRDMCRCGSCACVCVCVCVCV